MSLPSEAQSMLEDWYDEEVDRLLTLGYDAEQASRLAKQLVWGRMDNE